MQTLEQMLADAGVPDADNGEIYRQQMADLGIAEYFFDGEQYHDGREVKQRWTRDGLKPPRQFHLFSLIDEQTGTGRILRPSDVISALVGYESVEGLVRFNKMYDEARRLVAESSAAAQELLGNDSDVTVNLRGAGNLLKAATTRMDIYLRARDAGAKILEQHGISVTPTPSYVPTPISEATSTVHGAHGEGAVVLA